MQPHPPAYRGRAAQADMHVQYVQPPANFTPRHGIVLPASPRLSMPAVPKGGSAIPLAGGLQGLGESLHVVVGDKDEWLPDMRRFVCDCAIASICVFHVSQAARTLHP